MNIETVLLIPFRKENAAAVLSWIDSPVTLWNWATRNDFPLTDVTVFDKWHADPDVAPFEMRANGVLAGYGEVWCESDEPFAEIARVVIAPGHRGRGVGKQFVDQLANQVRNRGFEVVWVRLVPENIVAKRCYESAGFTRAPIDQECELNAGQPHSCCWLQRRF